MSASEVGIFSSTAREFLELPPEASEAEVILAIVRLNHPALADAIEAMQSGISVEIDGRDFSKRFALSLFAEAKRCGAHLTICRSPLTAQEFAKSAKANGRKGQITFQGAAQ